MRNPSVQRSNDSGMCEAAQVTDLGGCTTEKTLSSQAHRGTRHATVRRARAGPDILVEDAGRGGGPAVAGRSALFVALGRGHQDLVDLLEPVTHPEVWAVAYRELPRYVEWMAKSPMPHRPAVDLFRTVSW